MSAPPKIGPFQATEETIVPNHALIWDVLELAARDLEVADVGAERGSP